MKQACLPEFNPWNPQKGGRLQKNCPLISMWRKTSSLLELHAQLNYHTNMKLNTPNVQVKGALHITLSQRNDRKCFTKITDTEGNISIQKWGKLLILKQFLYLKIYFIFNYIYGGPCANMNAGACRVQKKVSNPPLSWSWNYRSI